jgi:hypothetical protein
MKWESIAMTILRTNEFLRLPGLCWNVGKRTQNANFRVHKGRYRIQPQAIDPVANTTSRVHRHV